MTSWPKAVTRTTLVHTMATSGRTVLFSAITVAPSMSATALFPMYFLKSFAYAGVATVAFVSIASTMITPAAIVLLGPRLDALDARKLVRRILRRSEPVHRPVEQMFWYRSSKFVMRRWLPIGVAVATLLVLLGVPFVRVTWGFPDDRVLPRSASAYQVGDQLRTNFAHDSATSVPVVIPDVRSEPGRSGHLRHGAVAGARRVGGIGAQRDVRQPRLPRFCSTEIPSAQ